MFELLRYYRSADMIESVIKSYRIRLFDQCRVQTSRLAYRFQSIVQSTQTIVLAKPTLSHVVFIKDYSDISVYEVSFIASNRANLMLIKIPILFKIIPTHKEKLNISETWKNARHVFQTFIKLPPFFFTLYPFTPAAPNVPSLISFGQTNGDSAFFPS